MSEDDKYNGLASEESKKLVDDYMDNSELVSKALVEFHEMKVVLDKRSSRRIERGRSLIKYDPLSGQGRMLALLSKAGEMKQADMARSLDVKPQTLSTAVRKLESKGLVKRSPDPLDARIQIVSITPAGLSTIRDLNTAERYSGSMFEALNDEELEQSIAIFTKLRKHLENEIAIMEKLEGNIDA